jgi:phospholipase/carboxylesterase
MSGGKPRALIILLHGYGSNGADMISLAPHWRRDVPHALFLAPNAPERCPGSPGGYQWWALAEFSRAALSAGAERATPALDAYIDAQLAEHDLTEEQLLLVGFSQGTMMALHVGPRRERCLAGIIGYSGMLADPAGMKTGARTKPPVLLVHGSDDAVVPLAAFHEARAALQRLDFKVSEHVSPRLGHGVDARGLELGGAFARRVLSGPSGKAE